MVFGMYRRRFLKIIGAIFWFGTILGSKQRLAFSDILSERRLGVSADGSSDIYVVQGGSPEENMKNLLALMGGIESIIGPDDIVVLKTNAQWWNQGMTNTNSMKEFIYQVLKIPGFMGEIIIADNHQYQQNESRGWTTNSPNGDYNLNQLVDYFQNKGVKNVTKYHWHCAGPNKGLVQGDAYGNSVVHGPEAGNGYAWRHDLIYKATSGRRTMMTYPVFTSGYSDITIDLKNGAWKDGKYLEKKVKLINFPGLNHHSSWAGVTCSVKNYLGIVDMSCGYHGETPKGFYNFHYVGNHNLNLHPYLEKVRRIIGLGYFDHFHGGPVGYFMKQVRIADLNIVTAHWVGYGSRTDPKLSASPRALLASTDPVALDYYAAKYVLLPSTPRDAKARSGQYFYKLNDPDNKNGPFRWYLEECHDEGVGTLDESKMKVHRFDFNG